MRCSHVSLPSRKEVSKKSFLFEKLFSTLESFFYLFLFLACLFFCFTFVYLLSEKLHPWLPFLRLWPLLGPTSVHQSQARGEGVMVPDGLRCSASFLRTGSEMCGPRYETGIGWQGKRKEAFWLARNRVSLMDYLFYIFPFNFHLPQQQKTETGGDLKHYTVERWLGCVWEGVVMAKVSIWFWNVWLLGGVCVCVYNYILWVISTGLENYLERSQNLKEAQLLYFSILLIEFPTLRVFLTSFVNGMWLNPCQNYQRGSLMGERGEAWNNFYKDIFH